MPASKKSRYDESAISAACLLGKLVQAERKTQRISKHDLATRLGVDRSTVHRLEEGNPKVELGLALEACVLLGISHLDVDAPARLARLEEVHKRLALLPKYARARRTETDGD